MKRLQAVTAEVWHAVKSSAEDVPDELRVLFAMLQRKAASYEQIFYIYGVGIIYIEMFLLGKVDDVAGVRCRCRAPTPMNFISRSHSVYPLKFVLN